MVRLTVHLDKTIAVGWDVKPQTKPFSAQTVLWGSLSEPITSYFLALN